MADAPPEKKEKKPSYQVSIEAEAKKTQLEIDKNIAASVDQWAAYFKVKQAKGLDEPYRAHHIYKLGADLYYTGLTADDSLAWLGLMALGPAGLAERLLEMAENYPRAYVGRLWPFLISIDRKALEALGQRVLWQREWARYDAAQKSWEARVASGASDDWRELPMTAGQRDLVQNTAVYLNILFPPGLLRGTAHDWLQANRANVKFKKGKTL